jgi:DNA-binding transcriptional LysR family regulator
MSFARRDALTPEALGMIDTIARTGSFAAAAREMGKVPSALTYNVRQLEEALDVLLFDRSSRQAKLTAAGDELLEHGRRVLGEVDSLANRVHRVATGWEASLTIAADGIVSRLTLFELIESFYSHCPKDAGGTQLRLRTEVLTGVWEALVTGQADLAIGLTGDSVHDKNIETRPLGEVAFVFVVAPHHPLAALDEPLVDDEIQRHRAIAVADSAQRLAPATYNLLSGQDVLTVASMQAKIEAQLRCLGCGYLPEPLVRTHIRNGLLVAKRVRRGSPRARMGYAWRADAIGKPRKPPQGLALQWWLKQLDSATTRQALLERHLGLPADVD